MPARLDGGLIPVMSHPKLFDFEATLKHETDNAFLVSDGEKDYWLPKSMTENNRDGTFTIPEWLAIEKGIV
jgi:hypothetical protein